MAERFKLKELVYIADTVKDFKIKLIEKVGESGEVYKLNISLNLMIETALKKRLNVFVRRMENVSKMYSKEESEPMMDKLSTEYKEFRDKIISRRMKQLSEL